MAEQVFALKPLPALHKRKLTLHDHRAAPIGMETGTAPQNPQQSSTHVQMPVKTVLTQERTNSATKTKLVAHLTQSSQRLTTALPPKMNGVRHSLLSLKQTAATHVAPAPRIDSTDWQHTSAVGHAAVDAANVTRLGDGLRKFPHALLNHYQQHGVLGSFYRPSKNKFWWAQPTILLGLALVCFIGVQVAALVYVGIHAHNSMKVLEAAKEQRPDRKAGLRELIPGISWADCVPYENRQRINSGHLNQRRAKDGGAPGDEQFVGQVAREGVSSWRSKQRIPYTASSGADASLQKLQRSTRPQEDLTPRGERAWDSLESTLAVATKQADKNKRIMDLLHQTTKPDSLSVMLDHEYEAMVQWDVENNMPGQSRREHISPTLAPFTC